MSGAVLLGVISLVSATDIVIALYFKRLADRAESDVGAPRPVGQIDPVKARRFANLMLITAPLMWLFFVALTFGLFGPVGSITPIKL